LGGPGPDGGGYVAELADHTLALAFNLGSPDLVHRSNDDLFLVHLDSIGNVISQKQFGTSANDDPLAIKASGDGNIIIASLWKYSRSWAVKTTTDGNIIWQTDSNGLPYDPTAALIGPDNSIYFGGFDSMQVKDTIPSLRDTFTMWIVKVDGNGHTVWRHHYRFTDSANIMISHPQPQQLALDDDGGLIIAGNGRINGVSHGFIAKLAPAFNDVKEVRAEQESTAAIFASGACTIPVADGRGTLRLVNVQGTSVLQTPISPGMQNIIFDVSRLPNGLYFTEMPAVHGRTIRTVIVNN
jgi:hypothetical protein